MIQTAKTILADMIELKENENALLIYDKTTENIASAFESAAKENNFNLVLRKIELTERHGADPDPETVAMIPSFNAVICPTFYSLTHCAALTDARARGIRGATLPGITDELFMYAKADSEQLTRDGEMISEVIKGHHEVTVVTDSGTAIRFEIGKSPVHFDTGKLNTAGHIGNIPCGEVFTSPDLGTMTGLIVIDGSIGSFEDWTVDSEPCYVHMKNGRAVMFSGDRGKAFEKVLEPAGESAFVACEFGIGTSSSMRLTGNLLGDEKLKGTIHIAFGNNKSFGGENLSTVHIDVMILNPTVTIDGRVVMYKGFWRF